MLENVDRLTPSNQSDYEQLRLRVADRDRVQKAIASLILGGVNELDDLELEGATHADCLIECEHAFVWIEGKRTDRIDPSIKWDVTRNQLARNLEAVWSLAHAAGKDYRMLLCHEYPPKDHDPNAAKLVEGYRAGKLWAGMPHVSIDVRLQFSRRIGTLSWAEIADEWCKVRKLCGPHDLPVN